MKKLKGTYFKSEHDNERSYIINVEVIESTVNCVVKVFSLDSDYNDDFYDFEHTLLCEIDVWPKYCIPVFKKEFQMYYTKRNISYSLDEVISLADAVNFGVDLGIKMANITPR